MKLDELDDLDKLIDNILTVKYIYKYLFLSEAANKFKYLSKINDLIYINN